MNNSNITVSNPQAQFSIGTQYKTRHKHPKLCTVVDIHYTYNFKGELVKVRYVAENELLGQKVVDSDVVAPTIARGLVKHGATCTPENKSLV